MNYLTTDERIQIEAEISSIDTDISRINNEDYDGPDYDPEEEYYNSSQGQIDTLYRKREALKYKLYEDSYATKLAKYKEAYNLNINGYKTGTILSDHETRQDLFNRKERAKLIADFICKPSTKAPMNIGIFAKWGEGKTTFLDFIEERININNSNKNFHIVKYDASEYEDREKIWANIAKVLFKAYESDVKFCKTKYMFSNIKYNRKEFLDTLFVNICFVILISIIAWGTKISFSTTKLIQLLISFGLSISGIILLVTKLIIPFVKTSISTSIPLSKKIIHTMKLPSYVEDLGRRESITEDINILFSSWFTTKTEKLVLFVDELDRCSQKGIVEFFQSIQLLSNIQNLVIIFAIDPTQLKNALQKEFKVEASEIDDFSTRYLDKYITLPISLKNDMRYGNYTEELISEGLYEDNSSFLSPGEKEVLKNIIHLIPEHLLTPRKTKKLINMLTISKEYCVNIINVSNNPIDFREYILWFIFSYLYKEASIAILNRYSEHRKYYPLKEVYDEPTKTKIGNANNVQNVINSLLKITMCDLVNFYNISNQITFSI